MSEDFLAEVDTRSGSMVAGRMQAGLRGIALGLLVLVLAGALELPEWLILVANLPVPWFGHSLPYLAPILFAVLLFNLEATGRLRGPLVLVTVETLLFVLFVLTLAAIEFVHWLVGAKAAQPWLVLAWFWILVFYLTLRSFEHYLPAARRRIAELTVVLVLGAAAVDFLLAIVLAPGWGKAPLGLNSDHLFDSAFVAYLAVFAVAILLFELPMSNWRGSLAKYGMAIPFLIYVAHLQRLSGPELIAFGLVALRLLVALPRRIMVLALLSGLLATGGLLLHSSLLAADPTLKGLEGGLYFADEIGVLHGDIISSYARRETILGELRLFLESPILGAGMTQASTVKILGSGMHSSLVYIPATSGLLGAGMFCLWLGWAASAKVQRSGLGGLSLFMVLGGMMMLAPEPVWWWSILFLLASPAVGPGGPRAGSSSVG